MTSRGNIFGFDLSDEEGRQTLRPRYAPYFQVTEYGRAVGYQRASGGRAYWVARTRLKDGNYRHHRLGFTNDSVDCGEQGMTFQEACRRANDWYRQASVSSVAADARPIGSNEHLIICPVGEVLTIGHALQDFIEWKRLAAARSHFLTLVTLINYHLVPRLASMPADEFNGEKLRLFIRDILETPPKRGNQKQMPRVSIDRLTEEELRKRKKTVNTLLSIIRTALLMAWENGKLDSERSWRCIRRLPVVDRPRMIHLSRAECFRLLRHCEPDLARLVKGALYTGCRATELLRMEASDFGRDGPGVYVKPVKAYRPRLVFLPDEGLAFFTRLAKGKSSNALLFLRDDGRRWYTNYRHKFKTAARAADLPDGFCFHGLRHTYASQLVQAGAPLIVVAEQLGHRNTDTVSRTYGHLAPQIRASEVRQRFTSIEEVTHSAQMQRLDYAELNYAARSPVA